MLEIISSNFLKYDLKSFKDNEILIIGNFPYNISSQIIFKVIENRDMVSSLIGMFQKEVASRICSPSGTKTYGILSVLTQLYYDVQINFDVSPNVFKPKPKVNSSVLSLTRKKSNNIACDEELLFKIVKLSFQQRRKKIKNSLKKLDIPEVILEDSIFEYRPEQLSSSEFVKLTQIISNEPI